MNYAVLFNWHISPDIFSFGPFTIRWYGLLFALGFVVGYQIMSWIFLNEKKSIKDLEYLSIAMILGTVIGARLGHCFFYDPEYYLSNPLEILQVWKGGLASHGAAIGILIALWVFHKKKEDFSYMWILDRIVIVIALAGFFIRFGNFFNSEILGTPANVPWAVIFSRIDMIPRHPAQLYEAFSYLIIFIVLITYYKKYKANIKPGFLIGLFLVGVFGMRFIIEYFKENQSDFESALPLKMGQILSIPFVLIGIYFIYKAFRKK